MRPAPTRFLPSLRLLPTLPARLRQTAAHAKSAVLRGGDPGCINSS
jgi:hypothetical protein